MALGFCAISIFFLHSEKWFNKYIITFLKLMHVTFSEWSVSIDVKLMSPFTHFEMLYTGFLALFMSSWTATIFLKRGCALYTKLRSIHHFKGLNKGCVLYTGASNTREITVFIIFWLRYYWINTRIYYSLEIYNSPMVCGKTCKWKKHQ